MEDTLHVDHTDRGTEFSWRHDEASKVRDRKFDTAAFFVITTTALIPMSFQMVESGWQGLAIGLVFISLMFIVLGVLFSQRGPVFQHLQIGLHGLQLEKRASTRGLFSPASETESFSYGDIDRIQRRRSGSVLIIEGEERLVPIPEPFLEEVHRALQASWMRARIGMSDPEVDETARKQIEAMTS